MKREHGITCTRSTFFRYIKDNEELNSKFKNNRTDSFIERFETNPGQQAQFDMKEKVKLTEDKTYRIIARAINNLDTEGDSTGEYVITITKAAPVINFNPNGNTLYKKHNQVQLKLHILVS